MLIVEEFKEFRCHQFPEPYIFFEVGIEGYLGMVEDLGGIHLEDLGIRLG